MFNVSTGGGRRSEMDVGVRSKDVRLEDSMRFYIERRLEFAFSRFAGRIIRVTVHIVDVNGPRGGEDKACRIEASLRPSGRVFIEDRDADLLAAVDRAADRAAHAIARALRRSRAFRRNPAWTPPPSTVERKRQAARGAPDANRRRRSHPRVRELCGGRP
jgi:putative sigma-54 modulation protein